MDIAKRIKLVRGDMTQDEFAQRLEIHKNSLGRYERGESTPDLSFAQSVCNTFGISPDWLLFGYGSMRSGETPQSAQLPTDITMVPMVEARLSAGHGSFETSADVEGHYAFKTEFLRRKGQASKMVLMRVGGESMQPEIRDRDTVLIDQSQTAPRPGSTYAVSVEDMVYLKIIDAQPGKLVLKSFNPEYAPIDVPMNEDMADSVRIIGRVVWLGREF